MSDYIEYFSVFVRDVSTVVGMAVLPEVAAALGIRDSESFEERAILAAALNSVFHRAVFLVDDEEINAEMVKEYLPKPCYGTSSEDIERLRAAIDCAFER